MQLNIKNIVNNGFQEEVILETFDGDYKEIAGKQYLSYKTDNNEKVVIKFDDTELVMTRYADRAHKMRFTTYENTEFNYLGLQDLKVSTESYKIGDNTITITYTILQKQKTVSHYQLEIIYED